MGTSKVYYSNLRVPVGTSRLEKLQRLIRAAGIETMGLDHKFTAIKIHFGEPGNLTFLRPNYAKAVADVVRELGGIPFLTDCNTLYPGRRKNALEHMESAQENGFSPLSTGCQIIIGDGLKGNDDVEVPVQGGQYVQTAKIGRAVMDADVFISLNHFKGHELTGFGGAIKNIGMGCGSRRGKMEQHNDGKLAVGKKFCVGCRRCLSQCAHSAITVSQGKASINPDRCVGCGRCIAMCSFDAIFNPNSDAVTALNCKMAEYAKAVVDGREHFHISLVIEVSPYCDCHGENDMAILPDVGMFASFDPVALDQACVDACLKLQPIAGSLLDDRMKEEAFCDHHDHFRNTTPESEWDSCLAHSEKIGLGSRKYELIEIS